ncbi:tRNA modification GTPase [Aurantibacter sp.]|uniref:tRNA modification GTPase n=1 Tax=Aurantibacter sp. TaxID=2807103 RepID=UPI003264AFEF
MIKIITSLLMLLCLSSVAAQIEYEKGYFINSSGERVTCLIRNVDWKESPNYFNYKLKIDYEVRRADATEVLEFGVLNGAKYIGASVSIDRSSSITKNLDHKKQPNFNTERLFLKVITEGAANLYSYNQNSLRRFFYSQNKGEIYQLVYKKYLTELNKIKINKHYRQQIFNTLKCDAIKPIEVNRLDYTTKSLKKIFDEFNKCIDNDYVMNESKPRKIDFNFWLRPAFTYNTFSVANSINPKYTFEFPNAIGIRFGTEFEFVLPYNKNKWSLFIEPTYQTYESEREVEIYEEFIENEKYDANVSYSSIELPIGVRYSMFLNAKSRIFIDLSFSHDFHTSSEIILGNIDDLEMSSNENFVAGLGYALNSKLQMEFRYTFSRNILDNYTFWSTDYKAVNLVLGYNIF